jgi:hypothetical protein
MRELMVRAVPPVLTREKTNGALAVFTVWGLKLKFKGEDVNCAPLFVTCATVAENGVVCVALLPVPTSVNEYVPVVAVDVAESVSNDWLPDVTVPGLKFAVTPVGKFEALRAMLWLEPLVVAVITVYETELP